jgi:hypothetical protein
MSRVTGRRDLDWPHVQRAPVQYAECVLSVPRSPPKTQSGEVSTFQKKVQYLGHIVSPDGLTIDLEKLKAVRGCVDPEE